jgi:hypothetical protein
MQNKLHVVRDKERCLCKRQQEYTPASHHYVGFTPYGAEAVSVPSERNVQWRIKLIMGCRVLQERKPEELVACDSQADDGGVVQRVPERINFAEEVKLSQHSSSQVALAELALNLSLRLVGHA